MNITFCPPIEVLCERLTAKFPQMQSDQVWEFLRLGIHLPPWLDGTDGREKTLISREGRFSSLQQPWQQQVGNSGQC